jgi:K+-sensing histidine kinase KdpD
MLVERKRSEGAMEQAQSGVRSALAHTEVANPPLRPMARYAIALLLVAAAGFLAFVASSVVPAPALTLIFVLPVTIAGTMFGLGPSIAAIVASVLAFDFFFTQPYLTFRMTDPAEIWAAGLLLITASIVSTVSWQSRRYAMEARRAAAQAEELRQLARTVVEGAPRARIVQAAATALSRMFAAPAAVYSQSDGELRVEAVAGKGKLSQAESAAAASALASGLHLRARTYPHEQSRFDMWPVEAAAGRFVLAVKAGDAGDERFADGDRLVEMVSGYIAVPRDDRPVGEVGEGS